MANGTIAVDEPAVTDKILDTTELTVGLNTVERERMVIAGAAATDLAPVDGTLGLAVNVKGLNGTATDTNSGNKSAGTLRVVIATDQPALTAVLGVTTKTALTPSSPTAATVGVASASAVAANASRKGLVLTNTSVNTIYLGLAATAVVGSGIVLYPGGTWVMDEYTYVTGAINAIASAASSNLAVQEFA